MLLVLAAAGTASAQERGAGAGRFEVTGFPAGGTFFTKGSTDDEPAFKNYALGASATVGLTSHVGIEGELGSMIATTSDLQFGDLNSNIKAPNMLSYTANAVVALVAGHAVVPYATGGIGGRTMFERPQVGVIADETFLSGNVGGGVKWYSGRWGLRGDYRFIALKSKDDAPAFFGQETRYGHRVYGGVLLNVGR